MAIRDFASNPGINLTVRPKLIIGLGNVGEKYELTRHNIGFKTVDMYTHLSKLSSFSNKPELNAEVVEGHVSGSKIVIAKPTTYMNDSGIAVMKLQNYFGINDEDILIVYDDVDVDFGTIRMRNGGSSGGHNGIKSIEKVIGDGFSRVRIGVKNDHLKYQETSDFVLSNFTRAELIELRPILETACEQIRNFINSSFEDTSITL